jgi:hypothetical protein
MYAAMEEGAAVPRVGAQPSSFLQPCGVLVGHAEAIACLHVSAEYNVVVSGSVGGHCYVWVCGLIPASIVRHSHQRRET